MIPKKEKPYQLPLCVAFISLQNLLILCFPSFFFFLIVSSNSPAYEAGGVGALPSSFCAFLVGKAPAVIVYQGSKVDYLGCIFV